MNLVKGYKVNKVSGESLDYFGALDFILLTRKLEIIHG